MRYILYKNPIQTDTLKMVRYLYTLTGSNCLPLSCIERAFPAWVTQLPSIGVIENEKDEPESRRFVRTYVGFGACLMFWLELLHKYSKKGCEIHDTVEDMWNSANTFSTLNPSYRINA